MGSKFGLALTLALALASAAAAQDAPPPETVAAAGDGEVFEASLLALTKLLVLAVLLENAFALIFNWRVFLAYFSGRGMRTLVMVAGALLVVYQLDLDIVADLVAAYGGTASPGGTAAPDEHVTRIVTALILAGGSSGVHNVMYALGYRTERAEIEEQKPPPDKAWLAVRAIRRQKVGEVFVRIREVGQPSPTSPAPIAGTIGSRGPSLRGLLMRDRNRFPQNGGYPLTPNVLYEVTIEARDANGDAVVPLDRWPIVLAPGAIVDLETTL